MPYALLPLVQRTTSPGPEFAEGNQLPFWVMGNAPTTQPGTREPMGFSYRLRRNPRAFPEDRRAVAAMDGVERMSEFSTVIIFY